MDYQLLLACFRGSQFRSSLTVALVVGTVLTMINQGDVILAGHMPVFWKLALTYVVPFFVSTYGAYSALSAQKPD